MRDCVNVEVRDALPELVHDRLSGAERERVLAHVGSCADCSAELTLLRGAHAAIAAAAPRVDAAAIARAVQTRLATAPAPVRLAGAPRRTPARTLLADWRLRVAAGLALVAGAAGLLAPRAGTETTPAPRRDTVAVATPTPPAAVSPVESSTMPESARTPRATPRRVAPPRADLALGSSFADLSDDELATIIEAVTGKDAKLPDTDPGTGSGIVDVEGRGTP